MIVSEAERRGIAKILAYLNEKDKSDVLSTVTNGLIRNVNQKDDPVQLILNYSHSAADCLKKKKIKKEIIFQYLKEEKIYAVPSSTKKDLIRECIRHWGSSVEEFEMECSDEDETCIEVNASADPSHNHQLQWMATQPATDHRVSQLPNQMLQSANQQLIGETDPQIINLSLNFGEWFYSMLPGIERGLFAVNNFWEDSLMSVEFEYGSRRMSLSETGAAQSAELLRKLTSCELRFRPNLLPQHDGVRAEMDAHGLLKSIISGIVYMENEPVGWFDHLFGLIAENSLHEHRWRIKLLQMKIRLSKPVLALQQIMDEHGRARIEG